MKNKSLIMGAAIAGLLSGSFAGQVSAASTSTVIGNDAGTTLRTFADDKDTHSCKGQNTCKGKGGCKASDAGCKAKNTCKGKGGCATDGSNK